MKTKAKKEAEKKEEPPKKRKILIKKKPVDKYESKKSNAADPAVKAKIDKLRKKGRWNTETLKHLILLTAKIKKFFVVPALKNKKFTF